MMYSINPFSQTSHTSVVFIDIHSRSTDKGAVVLRLVLRGQCAADVPLSHSWANYMDYVLSAMTLTAVLKGQHVCFSLFLLVYNL